MSGAGRAAGTAGGQSGRYEGRPGGTGVGANGEHRLRRLRLDGDRRDMVGDRVVKVPGDLFALAELGVFDVLFVPLGPGPDDRAQGARKEHGESASDRVGQCVHVSRECRTEQRRGHDSVAECDIPPRAPSDEGVGQEDCRHARIEDDLRHVEETTDDRSERREPERPRERAQGPLPADRDRAGHDESERDLVRPLDEPLAKRALEDDGRNEDRREHEVDARRRAASRGSWHPEKVGDGGVHPSES